MRRRRAATTCASFVAQDRRRLQSFVRSHGEFDRIVYGASSAERGRLRAIVRAPRSWRRPSGTRHDGAASAGASAEERGQIAGGARRRRGRRGASHAGRTRKNRGRSKQLCDRPRRRRMMYELAQRMGWHAERRLTPMDSAVRDTTIQVVIDPSVTLGAREVHRLLENVRRGGGLVFTIDGARRSPSRWESRADHPADFSRAIGDPECQDACKRSRAGVAGDAAGGARICSGSRHRPERRAIVTTRCGFGKAMPVASGFAMGKGRVAVVSSPAILANDAVGVCEWGADVVVARTLEYVRPAGDRSAAWCSTNSITDLECTAGA